MEKNHTQPQQTDRLAALPHIVHQLFLPCALLCISHLNAKENQSLYEKHTGTSDSEC